MRPLLVVVLLGSHAAAQPLPGTADDPAETLEIVPSVVDNPLGGFAVRGGTVADTLILLDGFEIPTLRHARGLRSVIPMHMLAQGSLVTAPDVSIGRAPTAVRLTTGADRSGAQASTFDIAAQVVSEHASGSLRRSVLDAVSDTTYMDLQGNWSRGISTRHRLFGSTIWSIDTTDRDSPWDPGSFGRATSGIAYETSRWRAQLAISSMYVESTELRSDLVHWDIFQLALDTRGELVRTAPRAAGLTAVEWRIGEQTNVVHHDLDVAGPLLPREGSPQPQHPAADDTTSRFTGTFWTPDAALWSSLAANLAPSIRATTGLRVDLFGRGGDVATQPRGELLVRASPRTRIGVAAGAYRRAPQVRDELFSDALNPERTTQVMARVEHEHQILRLQGNAFYIDRTRLVIRDDGGTLRNTGLGTAYGIEVAAEIRLWSWFVWATGSLSRSVRRDFLRDAERPSELDQPVRLDALVTKRHGRWQLGARVQIASGLPATAIQQSIYDADRDSYRPIFDRIYGERLPTRFEVDLRIDRSFRPTSRTRLDVFVDLQLGPSTIGYEHSFDYKQRSAIRLPVVPFAGLRGSL